MMLTKRLVWIVNTIRRKGRVTLKELDQAWQAADQLSFGEQLGRAKFIRWKDEIHDMFGIDIQCDTKDGYRYYIANPDAADDKKMNGWLLSTYDTMNTLGAAGSLRDRILIDEVPSSHTYLSPLVKAMKAGHAVTVTYRRFGCDHPHTTTVEPYCLKMFRRRWYMLALTPGYDKPHLYALDRIERLDETSQSFTLPADFDATDYFSSYFGVDLDDNVPFTRVVLRAYDSHQHYLRSLPLHPSQREVFTCDEYADFELLVRPNYELCMDLLRVGAMIEVIEPQTLRHEMHGWARDLWEMYKND